MSMKRRISLLSFVTHFSVFVLVALWVLPTAGLFISSIRDKDQLAISGWWTALSPSTQNLIFRTDSPEHQMQENGLYILSGTIEVSENGKTPVVKAFGWRAQEPKKYPAGDTAEMVKSRTMTVDTDGNYRLTSPTPWKGKKGKRVFVTAQIPPIFTLDNYREVLSARGIGQAFINSLTVTIPSTFIPILVAAFAAYALAWMKFPGRALLSAVVIGLLVVPLQMALIPLLRIYNDVGGIMGVNSKTYLGIWLAHTGFGLPLAIYLLKNHMAGLPAELMESARMDGATDFYIFRRIVLPLSFPALASFAIFQFLWVWNDLLVAMVFLGNSEKQLVLTGQLRELLGSFGGNWEVLTASAFVTIIVPLTVFFSLQRYLVRGLLAGSVKGG